MEACNTIEPVGMAGFVPAVLRVKMDGWRVGEDWAARPPGGCGTGSFTHLTVAPTRPLGGLGGGRC